MNIDDLPVIAVTSLQQMADLRNTGWRPATLYQVDTANKDRLAWFTYPTGEKMININVKGLLTSKVNDNG